MTAQLRNARLIITKPYDFFSALIFSRGKMIPSDLERRIIEAKQKVISMTVSLLGLFK